jgi:hypothetical protein
MIIFLCCIGAAALFSAGGCFLMHKHWQRRYLAVKEEMSQFSEDLLQMAELQTDIYRRISRNLDDIEEKVLDLAVPSSDGPLPLERRHQVLTMARKGAAIDEIARRLNMPKGEVELILSLRRYANPRAPAGPGQGALQEYARSS